MDCVSWAAYTETGAPRSPLALRTSLGPWRWLCGLVLLGCSLGLAPLAHALDDLHIRPPVGRLAAVEIPRDAVPLAFDRVLIRNRSLTEQWKAAALRGAHWHLEMEAAGGDVLEVRWVESSSGRTRSFPGGVVPLPDDIDPPTIMSHLVTRRFHHGELTVTLEPGAVRDASFPVRVTVVEPTISAVAELTGPTLSAPARLSFPVPSGDRMIIRFTDHCGNRSHLHLPISPGQASPTAADGYYSTTYPSPDAHADAERTGHAASAGTGVMLLGGDYRTSVELLRSGFPPAFAVQLHYRSSLRYDGPIGKSWDWTIDSRLQWTPQGYRWYAGDGRIESGLVPGDSPPGLFLRLVEGTGTGPSPQPHRLESADGTTWKFSTDTGLLLEIEQRQNRLRVLRDSTGRAQAIIDARHRRSEFEWSVDGRLAAIKDYAGRRFELLHDGVGRLETLIRPDGSRLEWDYWAGTSWIERAWEPRDAHQVREPKIVNHYDANGRVVEQFDRYGLAAGAGYQISPLDPAGVTPPGPATHVVRVIGPDGTTTDYGLGPLPAACLMATRVHLDPAHRSDPAYPGEPDPAWIEECFEYDPRNLRVNEHYYRDANTPAGQRLEVEHWEYLSCPSQSPDPRQRSRLQRHEKVDNLGQNYLVEEREYDGNRLWPTTWITAGQAPVSLRWSEDGLLQQRWVQNIRSGQDTYDIEETFAYDAHGRWIATWNANRLHDPSAVFPIPVAPSTRVIYYESGYSQGWLHRIEQLDRDGDVVLWQEFEYDIFGLPTRQSDESGRHHHVTRDPLHRVIEQTSSAGSGAASGSGVFPPGDHPDLWHEYDRDRLVRTYQLLRDESGQPLRPNPVLVRERVFDGSVYPTRALTRSAVRLRPDGVEYARVVQEYSLTGQPTRRIASPGPLPSGGSDPDVIETLRYDSAGLVLSRTRDPSPQPGDERTEYYAYDHAGRELAHYAPGSRNPRRTVHDSLGRPSEQVTPSAFLGLLRGDDGSEAGRVVGCFVTRLEYAPLDPSPRVIVRQTHSVLGSPPAWDDPTARRRISEERYRYDEAGRTTQHARWRGGDDWAITDFEHEPGGQLRRRTEPVDTVGQRQFQLNVYDDIGRVEARYDAVGNGQLFRYDARGRLSRQESFFPIELPSGAIDLGSRVLEFDHDAVGRRIERRQLGDPGAGALPLIERWAYDGQGRVREIRHLRPGQPAGIETFQYDLAGRMVRSEVRRENDRTQPQYPSEVHEYRYDHLGRLIQEGPGPHGRSTRHRYDGLGRPVEKLTPEGGKYSFSYDTVQTPDGSSSWTTREESSPRGVRRVTSFNELGDPIQVDASWPGVMGLGGPTRIEFVYAVPTGATPDCGCTAGRQPIEVRTRHLDSSLAPNDTIVRRAYDRLGHLERERIQVRIGSRWETSELLFSHDPAGRPVKVEYPSGAQLLRRYRTDGKLRALDWRRSPVDPVRTLVEYFYEGTATARRIAYDESSPPQEILRGEFTFDPHGLPRRSDWQGPGGTVMTEEVLQRDSFNQPTERRRSIGGALGVDYFAYAGRDWLTEERWSVTPQDPLGKPRSYVLDSTGRRIQTRISEPSQFWTHEYDDAGQLTEIRGREVIAEHQIHVCEDPPPSPPLCSRFHASRSQRHQVFNDDGLLTLTRYAHDFTVDCAGTHLFLARFHDDVEHEFTHDAWGRVVRDLRTGTRTREDLRCPDATTLQISSHPLSALEKTFVYDGLGRMVCAARSGPFDSLLDPDAISVTDTERRCYAYEAGSAVLTSVHDAQGPVSDSEYYRDPEDGSIHKGREQLFLAATDQLFTVAQDLNGFAVAGNMGAALGPVHAEPTVFSVDVLNPEGLLIEREGKNGQPRQIPEPAPHRKTVEERVELWDADFFGDDRLARFYWLTNWRCDEAGLTLENGTDVGAERFDSVVNLVPSLPQPQRVDSNRVWIQHVGLGSWEEFSWLGAIGGGLTGLVAGAQAGSQLGLLVGTAAAPGPGTVVGGVAFAAGGAVIGTVGGAITGGLLLASEKIATTRSSWEIQCVRHDGKFLVDVQPLQEPDRKNAGDLYWVPIL